MRDGMYLVTFPRKVHNKLFSKVLEVKTAENGKQYVLELISKDSYPSLVEHLLKHRYLFTPMSE